MAIFKGSYFKSWTDTNTGAKFGTDRNVWLGKYQSLGFADLAASGAPTQSEEKIVSLSLKDPFTKIKNARITKIHGTFPTGMTLNAGTAATAAVPKTAGVPSTVALNPIVSHLKPATLLESDFDATLNEYGFLYTQYDLATGAVPYDPTIQDGQAGYPLIQVAFPYAVRDADFSAFPAGNAPEDVFNRTGTWIFIVDNNGEMQLFGCFQNAMNFTANPEWVGLTKGALDGSQSYALNSRPIMIDGSLYGLGPFIWNELFHGDNKGSDGWHTQITLDASWQPVKQYEFLFLTYSDKGRELIVSIPQGQIRATGAVPFGQDGTSVTFEIVGEQADVYLSDYLVEANYFAMDIDIT